MEYIIETNNLCKNYMKNKVLKNLNVHVPKGSIYGLVGKNGAGKSTFMRVICGVQDATSGEYKIYGVSNNDSKINKTRSRIGAVIETVSMYPGMSAKENMKQQYRLLGIPSWDGIDELLELVGLGDTGKKKAKNFSLGMRQRLGLAMTLAGSPDCIILDEPMNGLDPEGIIEMRETIIKLNKEKDITFIISSHILDELSKVATHYGFIDDGHLVEEISSDEIEKKCRKSSCLEVSDVKSMTKILEDKGHEYSVDSETKITVFDEFDINGVLPEMIEKKCKLISVTSSNESLESYYLNLFGEIKKEV
ncbi:MAG: ATP-binding cassette domain-containing protein [Saccharofermentans sp.]|nr:ATP-binding cassette domain-containing protein [Saccharofermentans sp.]